MSEQDWETVITKILDVLDVMNDNIQRINADLREIKKQADQFKEIA